MLACRVIEPAGLLCSFLKTFTACTGNGLFRSKLDLGDFFKRSLDRSLTRVYRINEFMATKLRLSIIDCACRVER